MEKRLYGENIDQRKDGKKLSILSFIPAILTLPMMGFLVWCIMGSDKEWRDITSLILTLLTTFVSIAGFAVSFLIAMITTISRKYKVHPVSWVAVGVNAFTALSYFIFIFPVAIFASVVILLEMSPYSQKGSTLKYLKNKYGEEFVVHGNSGYDCICSPKNNPNIVFEARVGNQGTTGFDYYGEEYAEALMEQILRDDLKELFPDAYIQFEGSYLSVEDDYDFRNKPIEEVLQHCDGDGNLHIYINRDVGSAKEYQKEFEYFTKTIDEYIEHDRMVPLTVSIVLVEPDAIPRIEDYLNHHIYTANVMWWEDIIGIGKFDEELGVISPDGVDLGNPPNIAACFQKDMPADISMDEKEYIRRRELLEGAGN